MKKFERIRKISRVVGFISIIAAIATADSIDLMIPFGFVLLGVASILINKVCEARGR